MNILSDKIHDLANKLAIANSAIELLEMAQTENIQDSKIFITKCQKALIEAASIVTEIKTELKIQKIL